MPLTSDKQLLELWESGLVQHPVDRALTLLLAAEPAQSRAGLATLPLGELDGRLLRAYLPMTGSRLACLANCPACGEPLEFNLEADQLAGPVSNGRHGAFTFRQGEYLVEFRLPTSQDLAACAAIPDVAEARQKLLASCILKAKFGHEEIDPRGLPDSLSTALEEEIGQRDPQGEWLLALECAACGHTWQERLDIASFLWAQINARARRVLMDVHNLASAYGWSEAEILAMSAPRRQAYLELIG